MDLSGNVLSDFSFDMTQYPQCTTFMAKVKTDDNGQAVDLSGNVLSDVTFDMTQYPQCTTFIAKVVDLSGNVLSDVTFDMTQYPQCTTFMAKVKTDDNGQAGLETYFFRNSQTFASGFNLNSQIAMSNSQLFLQKKTPMYFW